LFESFKKSIGAININVPKYNLDSLKTVGRSEPVTIQMNLPLMVVEGNADEKVLTQINARLDVLIDKEIPQKMMEMSKQH